MAEQDDWVDVPIKKKPQDADDWQDVPIRGKNAAPQDDAVEGVIHEYILPGMRAVGAAGMDMLGGAVKTVDRYVGAPFRSGVQQATRGNFGNILPAVAAQFGEDPEQAPSGKDIAMEQGLSGEDQYNTGLILNPYTRETLKLSPAGIAGGVGEAVTDPLNFLPVGKLAKGALKGAELASKGIGKTAEFVTPKIAKTVARVPEDVTKEYMANRLRIKKTGKGKSYENIKDLLDDAITGARKGVDESRDAKAKLQEQLKQKMRERKFDLQRGIGVPQITEDIHGAMETQKRILGELSEQAEDILAKSNKIYSRKSILKLLDNIRAEAGKVNVGNEMGNALRAFDEYRERVADMDKFLSAPQVRDIFRQIREDTNRVDAAGAFNKRLDRMRMNFSERASDVVKDDVPEYAQIMSKAAPMARSLEEMGDYFGTPAKTASTLDNIRSGSSSVSKIKEDVLRRNAEIFENPAVIKALDEYEKNRNILDRIARGEDLSGELFPEDAAKLAAAERDQAFQEKVFGPIRRLNPETDKTQSVIRRFGSPNASIADRRAVERLSELSGVDFPQMIRDKNVYEAFDKDATAGSRNVNFFNFVPFMKPVGYAMDRYGGPVTRASIDIGQNVKGGIDSVLNYLQNDPVFAGKYGKILNRGAQNGLRGMLLYHHMLMNNDPAYRKYFGETN